MAGSDRRLAGRRQAGAANPRPADAGDAASGQSIRFDLWLWAARIYRTRPLAAAAINHGQAQHHDQRVKPAHPLRVGDRVTVRKAGTTWQLTVTGIAGRRGSASVAATLYRETEASRELREDEATRRRDAAAAAPRFPGRPTKRERRRLEDFLSEP